MVSKCKRHVSCDACFAMQMDNEPMNELESGRHYASNAAMIYVVGKGINLFVKKRCVIAKQQRTSDDGMPRHSFDTPCCSTLSGGTGGT